MRFIVYSVFLSGWMFMWWWTYVYHVKTCDTGFQLSPGVVVDIADDAQLPLSFKWSDADPMISEVFEIWRDSVINTIHDDQVLLITGFAYRDESGYNLLGAQRANAVARLFALKIPQSRILEDARVTALTADVKDRRFPGYRLRTLTRNAFVQEGIECTLIYFASDSSANSGSQSILTYLNRLQGFLSLTGELIRLQPFVEDTVDNIIQVAPPVVALRELMVQAGIPAESILVEGGTADISAECNPGKEDTELRDWILLTPIK